MAGAALTLSEAASVLEPAITEHQLRAIIHALHWQPVTRRRNGRAGRPHDAFDAAEIMRLHAALAPWLGHT
jgi:hypothetical protein